MMPRNLDRRVEVVVPVLDGALQSRLDDILRASLLDDTLAWELDSEGAWHKVPSTRGVNAQQYLQEMALKHSHPGYLTTNA
jgi:polyphosphate kinase